METDGRWVTMKGARVFIRTGQSPMDAFIRKSNKKEREQISVSRAKQRFKQNIYKYGLGSSFEDSILYYNLQKDEIKSLYEYAKKTPEYQGNKYAIDSVYETYKDGIN